MGVLKTAKPLVRNQLLAAVNKLHCIGLALTPVVAVLAAASIVARRGSLADSRLLILAFIQAFFCAVVYALFLWQTVFGMLGLLVIFGVFLWACSRKQKLVYPGVRL